MTITIRDRLLIELCDEQIKEDCDMSRFSCETFSLDSADFARTVSQLQTDGFITDAFVSQPNSDGDGVWFANLRNVWVTDRGITKVSALLAELTKIS